MKENKVWLITGGTGSFGRAFLPTLLNKYNPSKAIIFSRHEMKQWDMQKTYGSDPRVRFFQGDVRDKERLNRAFKGVDYVVHAAATKIVPTAEYNPFECIKTNVLGAMNVIDACIDQNVKKVVALSTDKASAPINLYGASKLSSDKLFIAGNVYSGEHGTRFSIVRYGNVMSSRGSVIPHFIRLSKDKKKLTVTDKKMTRFMISLEEGVDLVFQTFNEMFGGEIFIKKIPSMNILKLAEAIDPDAEIKIIGIRPGEKLHEQMISTEDAPFTFDFGNYYKILPNIGDWASQEDFTRGGKIVEDGFIYSSDSNSDWMSVDDLRTWIKNNIEHIGRD